MGESILSIVVSLLSTMAALVIATFDGRMKRWAEKPKLGIKTVAHNSQANGNVTQDVWRLLMENEGKGTAREVEVYAEKIIRNRSIVENFLPVPLQWTHYQTRGNNAVSRDIHPSQSVFIDLISRNNGDYRLRLCSPIGVFSKVS